MEEMIIITALKKLPCYLLMLRITTNLLQKAPRTLTGMQNGREVSLSFFWLCCVLVVVSGLFIITGELFSCGMWDLFSFSFFFFFYSGGMQTLSCGMWDLVL